MIWGKLINRAFDSLAQAKRSIADSQSISQTANGLVEKFLNPTDESNNNLNLNNVNDIKTFFSLSDSQIDLMISNITVDEGRITILVSNANEIGIKLTFTVEEVQSAINDALAAVTDSSGNQTDTAVLDLEPAQVSTLLDAVSSESLTATETISLANQLSGIEAKTEVTTETGEKVEVKKTLAALGTQKTVPVESGELQIAATPEMIQSLLQASGGSSVELQAEIKVENETGQKIDFPIKTSFSAQSTSTVSKVGVTVEELVRNPDGSIVTNSEGNPVTKSVTKDVTVSSGSSFQTTRVDPNNGQISTLCCGCQQGSVILNVIAVLTKNNINYESGTAITDINLNISGLGSSNSKKWNKLDSGIIRTTNSGIKVYSSYGKVFNWRKLNNIYGELEGLTVGTDYKGMVVSHVLNTGLEVTCYVYTDSTVDNLSGSNVLFVEMVVLKTANVNNNQIVLDYDHFITTKNNNSSGLVTSLNEEIGNGTPKIIPSNDILNSITTDIRKFYILNNPSGSYENNTWSLSSNYTKILKRLSATAVPYYPIESITRPLGLSRLHLPEFTDDSTIEMENNTILIKVERDNGLFEEELTLESHLTGTLNGVQWSSRDNKGRDGVGVEIVNYQDSVYLVANIFQSSYSNYSDLKLSNLELNIYAVLMNNRKSLNGESSIDISNYVGEDEEGEVPVLA